LILKNKKELNLIFSKLSSHVEQHPKVLVNREKQHRLDSHVENHWQEHLDVVQLQIAKDHVPIEIKSRFINSKKKNFLRFGLPELVYLKFISG